ncbi:MAG: pyruvate formate lyase family protein [Armatimonadota bacterium]
MLLDEYNLQRIRTSIAVPLGYDGNETFANVFMELENEHPFIRYTQAYCKAWENSPVIIGDGEQIVGIPKPPSVVAPMIFGLFFNHALMNHIMQTGTPEQCETVTSLADYFPGKYISSDLVNQESSKQGFPIHTAIGNGSSFQGHMVIDYPKILRIGISSLRNEVMVAMKSCTDSDKQPFYQAMLLLCDNINSLCMRYSVKTADLAEDASPNRKMELLEISDICSKTAANPPSSFREALQLFWFTFLLDGTDDPGRLDQFLYPFYINDINNGLLTEDTALELLAELWYKMGQVTAWSLVLGGQTPDGEDAANELTYLCLEVTKTLRLTNPAIALRVHSKTTRELWRAALDCIAQGGGHPSLINDDAVIPAMIESGVPLPEARDYAMGGCIEFQIAGKSNFGGEDGQINIAKCLELALNNGRCALTGELIGAETGDPHTFEAFDDVMNAYKQQVESAIHAIIMQCNIGQEIKHKQGAKLFRSLLVDDCINRGLDCEGGGALYGNGQILTNGLIVTADSLYAIKKMVYEDKNVTIDELLIALHDNWDGHEDLRRLAILTPRYGNDIPEIDQMAQEIASHFWSLLKEYKTFRGGHYTGLVVYFNRQLYFGTQTGPTPDGRFRGDVIEDSIGPWPGRDTNGPTAMMHSAASMPQHLAAGGIVLNLKLTPSCFQTVDDIEKTIDLIRSYFEMGGQQVQITVASIDDLQSAMEEPDKRRHLIVRVGGYSDYFVNLDRRLQESILQRTACKV